MKFKGGNELQGEAGNQMKATYGALFKVFFNLVLLKIRRVFALQIWCHIHFTDTNCWNAGCSYVSVSLL